MQIGLQLALSFVSQLLGLQGLTREQTIVNQIIAAGRAGQDVDAHMQEIADKLEAGETIDWDDLERRIQSETDEFLNR